MILQGDRAGTCNHQAAGFIHCAVECLYALVMFVIQRVRHPENGAQLADDLLIMRRQLTEGQMLLARVSFAVITGDVRDEFQVLFIE